MPRPKPGKVTPTFKCSVCSLEMNVGIHQTQGENRLWGFRQNDNCSLAQSSEYPLLQDLKFPGPPAYMAGWDVPSFTPLQDSEGSGGANRSSPTGGLAKGIPRKTWIPTLVPFTWTRLPFTCPMCVVRMGLADSWPVSREMDIRVAPTLPVALLSSV